MLVKWILTKYGILIFFPAHKAFADKLSNFFQWVLAGVKLILSGLDLQATAAAKWGATGSLWRYLREYINTRWLCEDCEMYPQCMFCFAVLGFFLNSDSHATVLLLHWSMQLSDRLHEGLTLRRTSIIWKRRVQVQSRCQLKVQQHKGVFLRKAFFKIR